MIKKIFGWALKHKWTVLIGLIILGAVGYWGYQKWFVKTATTSYTTAKVERGVLVTSISGTGQVTASNQVDIKAKTSGDVIYVGVTPGQEVKAGALLASLNARDALKAVRDAQANLDAANLSLQKIQQPVDPLTILQSENALAAAQESKINAQDSVSKAYEDAISAIASSFSDFPTTITALNDILFSYQISDSDRSAGSGVLNTDVLINTIGDNKEELKLQSFQEAASADYKIARQKYDANFADYKNSSRYSDTSTIAALLNETAETAKSMAQAAKSESDYINEYIDFRTKNSWTIFAKVKTYQTDLGTYISQINSHLASLLSLQTSLQDNLAAIASADRTIAEKTESLAKTKAGTDPLDIASQKLTVKQRENALLDARQNLADYSVRAQFDGILAAFTAKKGDSISSGASLGTLITKQKISTIALNEIDVAKVKVGQKVAITFDAVDGLEITGEVAEIDALGTVSQGVVSYNVKIVFDVQDDRIKPGMSVSASIILSSKPDVLLAPNSAVKTQGGTSYVETLINGAPQRIDVTIGDSNDTMTEIKTGLSEGQEIITQKITIGATAAASASGGGLGGGAFRALGR